MKTLARTLVLLAALMPPQAARAEGSLDLARSRYEEAAYEEALKILDDLVVSDAADRTYRDQYRALCLIALGETEKAEEAVRSLVDTDPLYRPPADVASPKVLAIVSEARRRHLPEVARTLLNEGRAAFAAKDAETARSRFRLLNAVLEDEGMEGRAERADFRTLAEGFSALLTATAAPAPAPAVASAAPTTRAPAVVRSVTPPVPIEETLPAWNPPHPSVARTEYQGAVRLQIGADGRVRNVEIERASHPSYDALLLRAARAWLYKPATRDGSVTDSERVVAIRLRPRQP